MSVKSVLHSFTSFLNHHVGDLNSVTDALQSLLSVVPVNKGTRDSINETIDRVQNSANNIAEWLNNLDDDNLPVVHISETDIENAVANRVAELLPAAVEKFMRENGFQIVQPSAAENVQADMAAPETRVDASA